MTFLPDTKRLIEQEGDQTDLSMQIKHEPTDLSGSQVGNVPDHTGHISGRDLLIASMNRLDANFIVHVGFKMDLRN